MRARWWVTIIALFLFGLTALVPPRARANDDITKPLIISGAIAGAVAVVFLIAILVGSARETEFPEFDTVTRPGRPPGSLPLLHCPQRDGGVTLVCW